MIGDSALVVINIRIAGPVWLTVSGPGSVREKEGGVVEHGAPG